MELSVSTKKRREVVDITQSVQDLLHDETGAVVITVLHTTAAVTTADLDPGTDLDLLDALEGLIAPRKWRHPHNPDHAPDHFLASIVGPSVMIPVRQGELVLGTWQRIILIEFDGPRERSVAITVVPNYT